MHFMSDVPAVGEAILEVIYPDSSHQRVSVAASPFSIGRGEECNLPLPDRRISRQCAAIISQEGRYVLEDMGNQRGIFVNREKIDRRVLEDGDIVSFGLD